MPYIGNPAVVGDSANTFKTLDGIASFTVTFDATDSGVVSIANNTLTFNNHRFVTGQKVTYNDGGGTAIGGLADGSYFIIKEDQSTIKLATNASNAASGTAIDLTSGAAGGSHTLNIAQDGINTKFKATHSSGTKAKVSRPAQITLSINGVIQQPTADYTIESDSTIVFSQAPEATDKIFASFIGEVAASFDISDNTVDEFTANGSLTTFTLSKTVPSNNDLLVTLDGVTQYPNTQSATRAYSVLENVLTFTSAPAAGVIIQVRHIGFGGASSQTITGFYGRTGNVQLKSTDDVAVNDVTASGNGTFTGNLTAADGTFSGNVTIGGTLGIGGTLTYEDVTNVDSVGLITARNGIVVGSGITLSKDGDGFFTGIVTATSFSGSGSGLTGVASTDNIRTNTNATFLQNINVSGTTTTAGITNTIASGNVIALLDSTNNAQNHRVRINSQGSSATTALVISNSDQNSQTAFVHENASALSVRNSQTAGSEPTSGTERLRVEPKGDIKIANNLNVVGTVTATSYAGDGSALTGIAAGISTEAASISGITTYLNLSKDDHELVVTGANTISVIGGAQGTSHTLRLQNSGIATVTLDSTYFKFPSGASPAFPIADGSISLVSFTVHKAGAVGVNTVLLTGASVSFS